jgi:hypothetical protein
LTTEFNAEGLCGNDGGTEDDDAEVFEGMVAVPLLVDGVEERAVFTSEMSPPKLRSSS